jgi:hypothetical protein
MMGEHYILDADHNAKPAELMEWAKFFEDMSKRRVANDHIGDVRVSTVFLGLDHSFGEGPPLIFETLIFGGPLDQEMWRYSTWDEAVEGHQHAVDLVREQSKSNG